MEKKAKEYSLNISNQIVKNISYLFNDYVDKFEKIALNSTIIADIYNYDELKEYKQIEVDNRIRYILASIVGTGAGIDSIEIRTRNGERFFYSYPISKKNILESRIINDADFHNDIRWNISRKEIDNDYDSYIILAKNMKIQFENEVTGYALMSIKRDYLDQVCYQSRLGENSFTIITDSNGFIVSHPDKKRILTMFDQAVIEKIKEIENMQDKVTDRERFFRIKTDSDTYMVTYAFLPRNHWIVINLVSFSRLMESTYKNVLITMLTVFFCLLVSIIFSIMLTRSISKPISDLMDRMNRFGHGDLNTGLRPDTETAMDEPGMLTRGFDEMVMRINGLVNDVYQSEIRKKQLEFLKKEAELNALQQQINPHFLYNTLETIFWTAQLKGEEEIAEMVTALGDFFRTSINKGLEYLLIKDEINNVKNYVYLQKIRFGNRFSVVWKIDEDILNYLTIKIILQPIIENGIVHGVENLEKDGVITISGILSEGRIVFRVIDNGPGMTAEQVDFINHSINNKNDLNKSIGLENVNQRIKLYFGDDFGVGVKSIPGSGTQVTVEIPALTRKPELQNQFMS